MRNELFIILFIAILSGCALNKNLVLYPILGTDFCVKDDSRCDMKNMDIGMSNFYFNTVLQAKIK